MSLHAGRSIKLHSQTPVWWDKLEQKLIQADMFTEKEEETSPVLKRRNKQPKKKKGFVKNW